MIVTVTTNGLASNGTICAPDNGTWTQVGSQQSSGTLSQATFYSARSTANAESYTFTFQSACSTTGTPLGSDRNGDRRPLHRGQPDHADRHEHDRGPQYLGNPVGSGSTSGTTVTPSR